MNAKYMNRKKRKSERKRKSKRKRSYKKGQIDCDNSSLTFINLSNKEGSYRDIKCMFTMISTSTHML